MTAKDYSQQALERLASFSVIGLLPALKHCNDGALQDVLNTNGCAYYQWSSCLMEVLKPTQVVELGGAMGVWDLCVLHTLPSASKLYSITLPEGGLEFSFVKENYSNFIPILGDDLHLEHWPKDLDLHQTDLWFFDALHTEEHLRKELEIYRPYFKKGTVLLFDDIRSFGLWPVWHDLPYDKHENTNPCHYSGFGIAVVN